MSPDPPGSDDGAGPAIGFARWAAAFSVHVFTALGAALGLLALVAATAEDWASMFALLGVALIVDGVDGTFARRLDVRLLLPRWSGDTLDLVVDFLTYVVVPAYAIAVGGLFPSYVAIPAGVVIVVTSALYFADRSMKMADNCFRGFPTLWNIAAFYLFIVRPGPIAGAAVIAVLAVLTFAPWPFIHPLRVRRLRVLSIGLLVAWGIFAILALTSELAPPPWITATLCAIALYFLFAGWVGRLLPPERGTGRL
jgi:phosphatidylcholine synthase